MSKHKAPAEVTVAPLFEKSRAEQVFDKYKVPAAAVIAVVVAWILFDHYTARQSQQKLDQSWEAVVAGTTPDMLTRLPTAPPENLAALAESLRDEASGPWARLLEVNQRLSERDYDGALSALATLSSQHPDHPLVTHPVPAGDEVATVVERLQRVAEQRKAWEAEHPELFANPPAPEGSPRVRLVTSAGPIEVALYADRAVLHVENFLKLCSEGYYDGTKFHRVVRDFMIQGGDPNSREEDLSQWGQGGPGYTLLHEPNDLSHFAGVLSAAKMPGETEESGSQFFLTTEPGHYLDGQHTIFGQIVAGVETVRSISMTPVSPEGARDRPLTPVVIETIEVVE